jgi:hypothetical protein
MKSYRIIPGEGKSPKQVAIYIIVNGILSTPWSIWKKVILLLESMFMDYQTTQGKELPTGGIVQLVLYYNLTNELARHIYA